MMYEILEQQEGTQLSLFPEEEWMVVSVELVPNPEDAIWQTFTGDSSQWIEFQWEEFDEVPVVSL